MAKRIIFSSNACEEYIAWQIEDKKTLKRINKLIQDIDRNGNDAGIGKPEPLRYQFQDYWSRRIDETNRLVCTSDGTRIQILQCKYHYGRN
ncbi:Txe/YoeB family addiction module toxin [Listeria costaricensis]|uniref:Txe/YoeB family addiction module toxin n=1 Tax=Listeria costaricensis TaxID=2026604 RepID=UPI000C08576E|nr:Txe/YoeB family addiction module toxin [Listeria costaricensis]